MQDKISLVMIVKNEEAVLERCLKSVNNYVDEIIIVDTGSTDRTIEIAQAFDAKLYTFLWCNDFSAARNFALSKAGCKYRLVMDADEYILEWDRNEVEKKLKDQCIGVISLIDVFEDEGEIKQSKSYLSRILTESEYYSGAVHEQIIGSASRIKVPIIIGHDGYLHQDKSERNIEILQQMIKKKPNDCYILYQLAHTLFAAHRNQEADPYYSKFYRKSKKDEAYRCDAIVDYLYNVMAIGKMEKGLEIIKKEKNRYSDSPDFNFVCGHFYREIVLFDSVRYINYLHCIEKSFLRCLEIGETEKYNSMIGTGTYEAAYNLAAWYEVTGQMELAKQYYQKSADWGYERAVSRLEQFNL